MRQFVSIIFADVLTSKPWKSQDWVYATRSSPSYLFRKREATFRNIMLAGLASDDHESHMADASAAAALHESAKAYFRDAVKDVGALRTDPPVDDDFDEDEFIGCGPDEAPFDIGARMEDEADFGPFASLGVIVKKHNGKVAHIK